MKMSKTIRNQVRSNRSAAEAALDRMRMERATLLGGLLQQAREDGDQSEVLELLEELENLI